MKATYPTMLFQCLKYTLQTRLLVGKVHCDPNSKLPSDFWMATGHSHHKLLFGGNWNSSNDFQNQLHSKLQAFYKIVWCLVVCQWDLMCKWSRACGSWTISITALLSATTELKVCVPYWPVMQRTFPHHDITWYQETFNDNPPVDVAALTSPSLNVHLSLGSRLRGLVPPMTEIRTLGRRRLPCLLQQLHKCLLWCIVL